MCAFLYLFVPALETWFAWPALQRGAQLALWVCAGAACYFAMLWLSGIRPQRMTLPPARL
jgi:hypothetical protein